MFDLQYYLFADVIKPNGKLFLHRCKSKIDNKQMFKERHVRFSDRVKAKQISLEQALVTNDWVEFRNVQEPWETSWERKKNRLLFRIETAMKKQANRFFVEDDK